MTRYLILIFSLSLCISCKHSGSRKILTLADVKFPDPEKEAVIKNNIREVYGFDTAELFPRYPLGRPYYGRQLKEGKIDTSQLVLLGQRIEQCTYDTHGNKTYYHFQTVIGWMFCGYGQYPNAFYDSLGFLVANCGEHGGSMYCRDSFSYFLRPGTDTFLVVRTTTERPPFMRDTTFYQLDGSGKPLVGIHASPTGYPPGDTTRYVYDATGKISVKEKRFVKNDDISAITTRYYYRVSGNLDSVITYYSYPPEKYCFHQCTQAEKRYYDEDGLLKTSLIADTLHVYYIHERFSDKIGKYHDHFFY